MHKAKENYRIFNNQQRREDSVDGSLAESISGVNPAAMAYDNPVFRGRDEHRGFNGQDPELNTRPLSNPTGGIIGSAGLGEDGGDLLNSFPMKNGSLFGRNIQRSESTSSDPKSFEPLPNIKQSKFSDNREDSNKNDLSSSQSRNNNQDKMEQDMVGSIVNF